MVFEIGEDVRLQCPKTKLWNIHGKIQGIRFNEAGTIGSYEVMLKNGNVTTRHRRYMTRDIPERIDDEAESLAPVNIHGGVDITESGHSGVVTRSKSKRRHANMARGNFQSKSRQSSKGVF